MKISLDRIFDQVKIYAEEIELLTAMARGIGCEVIALVTSALKFEQAVAARLSPGDEGNDLADQIHGIRIKVGKIFHGHIAQSSRQFSAGTKVKVYKDKVFPAGMTGEIQLVNEISWTVAMQPGQSLPLTAGMGVLVEVTRVDDAVYQMRLEVREFDSATAILRLPHTLNLHRKQIRDFCRLPVICAVTVVPLPSDAARLEVESSGAVSDWAQPVMHSGRSQDISGSGMAVTVAGGFPETDFVAVQITVGNADLPYIVARVIKRIPPDAATELHLEFQNLASGLQDRIIRMIRHFENDHPANNPQKKILPAFFSAQKT